jgi:hypothetical protein
LIWTQLQGAGREAVVNLLRAACNTADAFKVTRPEGEFFRHNNAYIPQKKPMTVCIFENSPLLLTIPCYLSFYSLLSEKVMKYSG